ncbi:MAG: zinc-ribbon domain-containing protein [Myxococcales bacterium]|nr:zinc-ribbon domain-containing protein [Myxococcales bacterium]
MDVICTRCQTRYDFDDALVSSRGTTVKCTHCGHLFRVHRPAGAGGFEAWHVRTADGRELVFDAMRDLQAAIAALDVGPDDVLIPGRGEPRRLGRLTELESFFAAAADARTRRRGAEDVARTAVGVGPDPGGTSAEARAADFEPELPTRSGKTLRPQAGPEETTSAVALRSPAMPRGMTPMPVPVGPGATVVMREPDAGPTRRDSSSYPPPLVTRTPAPPSDATPARYADIPPAPRVRGHAGGQHARHGAVDANADTLVPEDPPTRPGAAERRGEVPPVAPQVPGSDDLESTQVRPKTGAAGSDPARRPVHADDDSIAPAPRSSDDAAPTRGRGAGRMEPRVLDSFPPVDPLVATPVPSSPTPSAARPSVLRRSHLYSDPRFTGLAPPAKQSSFARWIVGLLALGLLGVGGFTLLRRYLPSGGDKASASAPDDSRLAPLLELAQERLDSGDVDGAKAVLDKARGVSEKDARVWRGLAIVEIVRADRAWLELALRAADDPRRPAVEQDLRRATQRVEDAVETAVRLAPEDPAVTRLQVHELRLKGNREAARRLVREFREPGRDDALVLAALDLAEPEPNWTNVVDRLAAASRAEKKLGHAQTMLVYALAMAGQKDRAERELAELDARTQPQALLDLLRKLVGAPARAEADAGAPSATAAAAPSADPNAATSTTAAAPPPREPPTGTYPPPPPPTPPPTSTGKELEFPVPTGEKPPPTDLPPDTATPPPPPPPPPTGIDTSDLP